MEVQHLSGFHALIVDFIAIAMGADAVAIARAAILNPDWARRAIDPAWEPKRPPATIDELLSRGLSDRFAGYMRAWKGFVQ